MLRSVVFTLALLASLAPGHAAKRVALVIGNGAYASLAPTLPNPPRDAAAISATLNDLGFTVETVIDGTKSAMDDALARLSREARSADVVLLFYAGHGIQDQGRNYLAPIDAALDDETDLRRRFVRLDDVLDDLSSAKGARILLLDACRDNDAVEALRTAVAPSRAAGITRGLARVSAANGQLVAFATQPDRVATDGDGQNSPFTAALVKHFGTPGIELRTALTRVRGDVAAATNNDQIREVADSLLGEVYLSSAPAADAAAEVPRLETEEPGIREHTQPDAEARAAWDAVKDTTSVAMLKTYIAMYPDSIYAGFAQARVVELEAETITTEKRDVRPSGTLLGCFHDPNNPFDLDGYLERSAENTPERCVSICREKGYPYAGVQFGESCLCGTRYGQFGPADNCNYACTGNGSQVCGGYSSNSVYATGL